MSEDFDKEAERERLRAKYDSKAGDREITERMSQLLLQGATMTNKHCDSCGSPIFRYQGQEFCPTCQAEAQEAGAEAAGEEADPSAGQGQQAVQSQATRRETDTDSDVSEPNPTSDRPARGAVGAASTGTAELGGGSRDSAPEGRPNASAAGTRDAASDASGEPGSSPTRQLNAVGQSLAETIATLSDRARETEDPHRAKALLEAAHEAAETLAVLQGE